ncbi:MAG: type VI secretion system tip protein TssI/VgrG [Polyangiaceae bacterium]
MNETTMWLSSPDDDGTLGQTQIIRATGTERLGQLYDFELDLMSPGAPLDVATLLEMPLSLHLRDAEGERVLHGIAAQVSDRMTTETEQLVYRLRLVPRAWRLSLTRTTEIFMDLAVPEVIVTKLERAGLVAGQDIEQRLRSSYPSREYIVQYDESDLSFVQRLAEHVGITLGFVQGDDRERIVLADHNEAFPELGEPVTFHPRGEKAGVFELSTTTSTLPARCAVKDYNYRTPQVALLADEAVAEGRVGLVYEYGGHFKTQDEARQLAAVRAEEVACGRTVLEGRATDLRLGAGARLKLEGHPRGELELLVTEVSHRYHNAVAMHGAGEGTGRVYECEFAARLQAYPYRPPRVTPKPRIHGCITAQVESTGDGPYAELDDEGRYHVRFLFDVTDRSRGGASRLVRMAQPHAGPGYGFHFPLRHGVEVLITFIDGDPDRPIISTAVPNPQTPSVVGAGNGTRNIIRTGGGNEINIDDTKGAERIKLSTPSGGSTFQLGAPNTPSAGASLATSESWNAVADAGVTVASTTVNTIADFFSCMASGDIIATAGVASMLDAFSKKAPDIVEGVAKIVDSYLDLEAKGEKVVIAEAKEKAQQARDEIERLKSKKRQWEAKGSPATTNQTEQDFDTRIANLEREAAQHETQAKALEAQSKENDIGRGEVKKHTDRVKTGKKMLDAWSGASKLIKLGMDTGAKGNAAVDAAAGAGFAAVGRVPGVVLPPGSPLNLQSAMNGAALVGAVSALVSGKANAAVVSPAMAVVAGGGAAHLKSPGVAEVAGMARTLVTSGAVIDMLSGGTVKCVSAASTRILAGSEMKLHAGGDLDAVTGSDLSVTVASQATVKSGAQVKVTSGAGMDLKATGTTNITSDADVSLKASGKASMDSGGEMKLASGADATVKASGVLKLEAGGDLKAACSAASIEASGAATLKGNTVTVDGTSVTIKGRVLLG